MMGMMMHAEGIRDGDGAAARRWDGPWRAWCAGDGAFLEGGAAGRRHRWVAVATVILGWGLYGYAVGYWRAPLQGLYVAVKLPLVVFATMVATGVLNAILATLLGGGTGFRQSMLMVLISFAVAGLMVGSLAPLAFFMGWNAPPPDSVAGGRAFSGLKMMHTIIIAYAGVVANVKLLALLRRFAETRGAALKVLFSWLAANLFVGAQIFWIFRPYFGQPRLPVEFLRDDPMEGNFYEALWAAVCTLMA
jgi:hypothetical protein